MTGFMVGRLNDYTVTIVLLALTLFLAGFLVSRLDDPADKQTKHSARGNEDGEHELAMMLPANDFGDANNGQANAPGSGARNTSDGLKMC